MLQIKILFALLYDALLLISVLFVTSIPYILWQGEGFTDNPINLLVYQIYLLVISYIYLSYFWLQTGQTPGLRTWKLRLTRQDDYILTRKDSIIRFTISLLSLATLGLGWIWVIFNPKKLTLHDQLSLTKIEEI